MHHLVQVCARPCTLRKPSWFFPKTVNLLAISTVLTALHHVPSFMLFYLIFTATLRAGCSSSWFSGVKLLLRNAAAAIELPPHSTAKALVTALWCVPSCAAQRRAPLWHHKQGLERGSHQWGQGSALLLADVGDTL